MSKQQRGLVYVDAQWQRWLADNLASGSQPDDLLRLMTQAGFAPSVAQAALAQWASQPVSAQSLALVGHGSEQPATGCGMRMANSAECDACWSTGWSTGASDYTAQSVTLH